MPITAEIDPSDERRILITGTSPLHKDLMNTIPGCRWSHKITAWHIPLGWAGCLALRSTFRDQLEIGPQLQKWATNELETRINPCMALRDALEADGSESLYPYQRAGVAFLSNARRAILADEQGTGKTRQTIMAMQQIYMNGENPFPALVVCPNSVKESWRREAEAVWPGLKVLVIKGSAGKRRKLLETPAHIYVMNWESLRTHSRLAPFGSVSLRRCVECGGQDERITITKCQVHQRELNQLNFNAVVADECHRMKDPKAQVTRALWAATGDANIRFALSGTPIASTPDDLWPILHWLSPEEWPSRTRYIERNLEVSYNAFGAPTIIGVKSHMRDEFFAALDPRLRRMSKDAVLRFLPPIVRERRDVEMTPKQAKAYNQMVDQMIAELDNGDMVVTTSPLVRVTRLLQFASSYAEIEKTWNERRLEYDEHVKLADPSCKIDAFMKDLDDFGEDQIVVFAVSRQLIELLSAKLEKAKIPHGLITGAQTTDERQNYMDLFQAGKLKLMLCTVAAGGTGITLTAARVGVFLQRPWSMIDSLQAEARLHRIGSEVHDSVLIVDYVTEGTLEETVIAAIEQKSNRLEEILRDRDLLRKVIEGDK